MKNENESVMEKMTEESIENFKEPKLSIRESETEPNICMKIDKELVTNKADSLPRSFQLNNQIDCKSESYECLNLSDNKSLKDSNSNAELEM